jgi:hypothetical protein
MICCVRNVASPFLASKQQAKERELGQACILYATSRIIRALMQPCRQDTGENPARILFMNFGQRRRWMETGTS